MENLIASIIIAATPFIFAATGELVVERSGVLNLGLEGMMLMGAVTAFAISWSTGNAFLGVLAGAAAGAAMALLFAVFALSLLANQPAVGLALTIFGIGASGLIGQPFIGEPLQTIPSLAIPWLSESTAVGRLMFGQDGLVYLALALATGTAWFLSRTRAGLALRAVGDNPDASHALGLPGHSDPLSRDAVRRRARRAWRRLSLACVHAALDREHDIRTRLDIARAGGLRDLAPRPAGSRRLPVRGGYPATVLWTGLGRAGAGAIPRHGAVCVYGGGTGYHLAGRAPHQGERAGGNWQAVPRRTLSGRSGMAPQENRRTTCND